MGQHSEEIKRGARFTFGADWSRFLSVVNDERVDQAKTSLRQMLETETLQGKTFLDVGAGSGLFSLAARVMGATMRSFDYDPESVACTMQSERRYRPEDPDWQISEGSALDAEYLASLGRFDVVYSWGDLRHTGHMWDALANAAPLVRQGGKLHIPIDDDRGGASKRCRRVKQSYNRLLTLLRLPYVVLVVGSR